MYDIVTKHLTKGDGEMENYHLELGLSESYAATSDCKTWLRWAARVESILGHSLDGDQTADGYSIDFAVDAFDLGATPEQYSEDVLN